jgi:hypothetical protein
MNNFIKRIALLAISLFFASCLYGQNKICYVVFTHVEDFKSKVSSIGHSSPESATDYDPVKERCPSHFFRPRNPKVYFYRTYYYSNPVDSPDNPIIYKPVRFLETVDYLDWDKETIEMSYKQLVSMINEINTHDTIYFIDRAEIKDGMMKMYPVKEMKSLY